MAFSLADVVGEEFIEVSREFIDEVLVAHLLDGPKPVYTKSIESIKMGGNKIIVIGEAKYGIETNEDESTGNGLLIASRAEGEWAHVNTISTLSGQVWNPVDIAKRLFGYNVLAAKTTKIHAPRGIYPGSVVRYVLEMTHRSHNEEGDVVFTYRSTMNEGVQTFSGVAAAIKSEEGLKRINENTYHGDHPN